MITKKHIIQNSLKEFFDSHYREIEEYKWIESQRVGEDIGWDLAKVEWDSKHFSSWKRFHWDQAIQDALRF